MHTTFVCAACSVAGEKPLPPPRLELFFVLGDQRIPLFIEIEDQALFSQLQNLGSIMKPPIDLR
jgi:hypothetical protein